MDTELIRDISGWAGMALVLVYLSALAADYRRTGWALSIVASMAWIAHGIVTVSLPLTLLNVFLMGISSAALERSITDAT